MYRFHAVAQSKHSLNENETYVLTLGLAEAGYQLKDNHLMAHYPKSPPDYQNQLIE